MPESLILSTRCSHGLQVVFEWQHDRWHHRIVTLENGVERTWLRSIEGDGQLVWPPSPALQDAASHALPAGDAVLAVGKAGTSHWSASISAESSLQDAAILFDIACLCKVRKLDDAETSIRLTSQYELANSIELENISNRMIALVSEGVSIVVEVSQQSPCETEVHCLPHSSDAHRPRIQLSPRVALTRTDQATRWQYRMTTVAR